MSDTVVLRDKGLKQLLKAFKDIPSARIGVLGGGARGDDDKGPTNAEVLAAAEYGTEHSPVRSVLRQPLSDNLGPYLGRAGAFDRAKLELVIKTGSIRPWVEKVAATAEEVVQEGFNTQGFGKWPDDLPETMARKKVKQVMVETQQVRNAITSEVK